MNTIALDKLPADVQQQVKDTLTTYTVAYVERENGEYRYVAGLYLDTRIKAPDFATFEIKADDIYSPEERAAHRVENSKYNWEAMNC